MIQEPLAKIKRGEADVPNLFLEQLPRELTTLKNNKTNDIANISFKLAQPLIVDDYNENRGTGAFIIIDETTFHTVGAGMIQLLD